MKPGQSPPSAPRRESGAAPVARWPALAVVALLVLAAVLTFSSARSDSITYDETSHLTAGYAALKFGDFRLAPDHPPLAKMWAALPLLLVNPTWIPPDAEGWRHADPFQAGRVWLFEFNDGERLMSLARSMMIVLLLALCAAIYAVGRRLFGASAGLLALTLAVLSPTMLAHGRLVTTDVPITLTLTLTLLAMTRILERVTWGRLLAVGAALGASAVTKMSWPLVLPALAAMVMVTVVRTTPLQLALSHPLARQRSRPAVARRVPGRRERATILAAIGLFLALVTWAAIWTCYRWRASMLAEPSTGTQVSAAETEDLLEELRASWLDMLRDTEGQPRTGWAVAALREAADLNLVPDAYLFGLAWTLRTTSVRSTYFCGQTSQTGWGWYFPVAFAIKTPIAALGLMIAGVVAFVWRRRGHCGDPTLLAGLVAFVLVYSAYAVYSRFNIGERHLLPVYPALFVLGGASAAWLTTRVGRWLVPAALVWLAGANLWIYPEYLSYFNESIGGPRSAQRYLVDSNLDWGQGLKRLARYAARHPSETIKLSYFGSADPTCYGFRCRLLPSSMETGSVEHLDGGGLYVISVTHLLGVYDPHVQEDFWEEPRRMEVYRELGEYLQKPPEDDSDAARRERTLLVEKYAQARWGRFLYNLRRRPPDERIDYSLWVYRLTQADIDALTRP